MSDSINLDYSIIHDSRENPHFGNWVLLLLQHPAAPRYRVPFFAYLLLVLSCLWAIFPSHLLFVIGRILGEHWYSVYNCMLLAAVILIFSTARIRSHPALAWKVWDLTLCCAVVSLVGKLFPFRRPSGGMHGFPSGHALTAFAAACLLMNTFPKIAPYAFIIAVAVGWSRVEIHEHFAYQVLFGAIFGLIVGAAVSHAKDDVGVLLPRILRRRSRTKSEVSFHESAPPVS